MRGLFFLLFLGLGVRCQHTPSKSLFTDVTIQSGITFRNNLEFTEKLNPYTYRNFYNGAGVAIGDVNNDGLPDVYFAGNQVDNKLFLNVGDFTFKDITQSAGVACRGVWSTGVTMVDINADGWLDIYVCKSGNPDAPHRNNELFINNKDLTFTERSREYGLDIIGLSVQASFFDFDRDDDLDCYLLTNSLKPVGNFDLVKGLREIPDSLNGGNKFFINENGKFRDYSAEAGIYRSAIGFGLGITLGDFNEDLWVDVFVSNDFFERDYLYINNQKGGFTESLEQFFKSISMGSMGADFADLDNDGSPELFVTEMLPDSLNRRKSKTVYESWNKYQINVENEYYYQFSRNVLQKKTTGSTYAEIGRLAGVAATEWSWGALLFDMDNDGLRDIFVANGIYKDLLDRDYLTYTGAEENVRKIISEEKNALLKLIDLMPSSYFPNYAYKNNGNLLFVNNAKEWGLAEPMFSCGSAYGDLDNDGDLDLVVNNINSTSRIFRNNTDTTSNKSLTMTLTGTGQNRFALGSHVKLFFNGRFAVGDNFVSRGFQSSVSPSIHIGLGKNVNKIDSIEIIWPDGQRSVLDQVKTNQILKVKKGESEYSTYYTNPKKKEPPIQLERVLPTVFKHVSSGLVDFNRDRLIPEMYSNETPSLSKGDINKDGLDEIYIGGGRDQAGGIIQFTSRKWALKQFPSIREIIQPEETGCHLFDADKDGDLDLYSASGGRFYPKSSTALIDKLFINDGTGNLTLSKTLLPFTDLISTSAAKSIDYDNDGDQDLLIGERFDPFYYGLGGSAFLFENDGFGKFKDVTSTVAPALTEIGMVTDFAVGDFNLDGWTDFVMVGDWMSIRYFQNKNGLFTDLSSSLQLNDTEGWWHKVEAADFNGDGISDFVLGNHGLNSFFKSTDRMYVSDFDQNGSIEQIFCTKLSNKYYPIHDKDEFLSQLPSLKKELLHFKEYSKRSIDQIFSPPILSRAKIYEVKELASLLLLSSRDGYERIPLPLEAQYSPIYAISIADFDKDGTSDLIAGGNQYQVKPQFGRYDASNGWFFKGMITNEKFSFQKGVDLNVKGEIRDIEWIQVSETVYLFFAKHNDDLEIFKIK